MDNEQLARIAMRQGVPAALDLMTGPEWDHVKAAFVERVREMWSRNGPVPDLQDAYHAAAFDNLRCGQQCYILTGTRLYDAFISDWPNPSRDIKDHLHRTLWKSQMVLVSAEGAPFEFWQRQTLAGLILDYDIIMGDERDA